MTSFSPSARKAFCWSRNFFSASALMSLTSGLARLVTSLTWPGAPVARRVHCRHPAREQRGRQRAAGRFFADDQFAGFDGAAHAGKGVAHQRVDGEERRADRIGGEHHGERLRRQDRAADVGQCRQVLEQLPDLALGTAPIGRRVEQDDVVAAAAALLALGEFHGVLADPADRLVDEAGHLLVLARPADRLLRGVDMGDLGAGARRDQRGEAGIAEQVEHLDRPPRAFDQAGHVIPVRGLLGKHADMAERGEAAEIVEPVMAHRPGLAERRFRETPAAHPFLVGVAGEDRVGPFPFAQPAAPFARSPALPGGRCGRGRIARASRRAAVDQRIVGVRRHFEDQRQPLGG